MAESIDPGAPKVGFFNKNLYFWAPFWHRFFDFFRKRRKCVISEEYNAKRGSEPSKTCEFRIDFSYFFDVFPNSLPETIFRGSKRPSMLTNPLRAGRSPPAPRACWIRKLSREFPSPVVVLFCWVSCWMFSWLETI